MNLWALGVLLGGACHLSMHKMIRKGDLVSFCRFQKNTMRAKADRGGGIAPTGHEYRAEEHVCDLTGPLIFYLRYIGGYIAV